MCGNGYTIVIQSPYVYSESKNNNNLINESTIVLNSAENNEKVI